MNYKLVITAAGVALIGGTLAWLETGGKPRKSAPQTLTTTPASPAPAPAPVKSRQTPDPVHQFKPPVPPGLNPAKQGLPDEATVRDALASQNEDWRGWGVLYIDVLPKEEQLNWLDQLTNDESTGTRKLVYEKLGALTEQNSAPAKRYFEKGLHDPNEDIRNMVQGKLNELRESK
jgi:hypothetical protein